MSLQFSEKNIVLHSVKCFAQVQVDDIPCSSLIHQYSNPIVEGHLICQAPFVRSEAMLAVINHLLILHVPYHSFQEDMLHDLDRHRGETDWPVVPRVFHFTVLKTGVMFPLFQVDVPEGDCDPVRSPALEHTPARDLWTCGERSPWAGLLAGFVTQWGTHARAACSWRTAPHGRDPHWGSSWRAAARGKDSHWSSLWRTVSHRRDPMLEQRKSVRSPPPEEEGATWRMMNWLLPPFPVPLCHSGGGCREKPLALGPVRSG